MAREKEAQAAYQALERMRREAETLEKQAAEALRAAEEGAAQFLALQKEFSELGSSIDVERKDIDGLTDQLRAMEEERAQHLTALDEMRERREKNVIDLGDLRERRHKSELNQSRSQLELANMQDRIWNDEGFFQLIKEIAVVPVENAAEAAHLERLRADL